MLPNKQGSAPRAFIASLEGLELQPKERDFFRESNPLGFILFARNCKTPEQLRRLTQNLKDSLGRDCPVLIDQEGGRVQRLRPPLWRAYSPMKHFGDRAEEDREQALEDLRFTILQLAEELVECGINVNCAPVLDVLSPETHDAIGDRAFSDESALVARLGLSVCRTLLAAGVTPVIKHLPGHGRAATDSHKTLPRVKASQAELKIKDFEPFRFVCGSDIGKRVWGMAAHVIYEAIDPEHPASVSQKIIKDTIRIEIGFDGFLLSDDLDMEALSGYGDISQRAQAVLDAGCDAALYCGGDLAQMEKIAKTVPELSAKAHERLQRAENKATMAA